ncbi:MAG: PorV/PorQ family protein [Candidatus Zhuqueibacterota bacterium]
MKKVILLIVIAVSAQALFGQGEVNKVGTTAANFLKLEVGARAMSLAGAYTAVANDVTALQWNPAGISSLGRITASYNNTNLYAGIKHQFLGVVVPMGINNFFGFSLNYVDIGRIEKTTVDDPDGTGIMFDNYNMSAGVSYSRMLTDRVTFGVTGRWVHEQIWEQGADGVSMDMGIIFAPQVSGLKIGMSITNFGPDMTMDNGPLTTFAYEPQEEMEGVGNRDLDAQLQVEKYALPISFQLGASVDIMGANSSFVSDKSNRISAIFELNDSFDNAMRAKYALEYEWRHLLALRAGYKQNYDLATFSWGGGLKIPVRGMDLRFDYGMADYGDLGYVNVTSIQIGF